MSDDVTSVRSLPGNRRWSAQSGDELPIAWSVDSAGGLLQGPLDLGFLQGRRLSLTLDEGQLALLLGEGRVQAVFRPGRHELEIGTGDRGIDPAWRLLFLLPGNGLALRWTAESPLRCDETNGLALIGTCRLDITDPHAFHDTFLAGVETLDPVFTLTVIDRLVQGAVAALLQPAHGGMAGRSPADLQARLTLVGPGGLADDLADDLTPCGLVCRALALYTARPPIDQGRSRPQPATGGETVPMSGHSEDLRRN